jgi:hypothetical protein
MRERTKTWLRLWGCAGLVAAVMAGGCAKKEVVRPAAPVRVPRMPTKEFPIVDVFNDPGVILMFGGEDGTGRYELARPAGFLAFRWAPGGRMIGVMTDDGVVRFYDVFGEMVGRAGIKDYPALGAEESQATRLLVSSDGQAVVSEGRHQRLPIQWHQPIPQPPVEVRWMNWYVNREGASEAMEFEEIMDVRFVGRGRMAVVEGPEAAVGPGPEPWHLTWCEGPGKRVWRAGLTNMPSVVASTSDSVTLYIPGGYWLVRFTAEGTYSMVAPDVEGWKRANAGYVERAGAFYEKDYLPGTLTDMESKLGLNAAQKAGAEKALRQFIHDWLVGYVEGGGFIMQEEGRRCMAEMDGRMREVVGAEKFEAYLTWRKSGHALKFLMGEPGDPRVAPQFKMERF